MVRMRCQIRAHDRRGTGKEGDGDLRGRSTVVHRGRGGDADDSWFKCKLAFITIDEKTDKEKRSAVSYLVQADSLGTALNYVVQEMGKTSIDYVASNISETKIMDVYR